MNTATSLMLAGLCLFVASPTCDRKLHDYHSPSESNENDRSFRMAFYNTENLFDIYDDPLTEDDEFTPGGDLHWTAKRYKDKMNKVYKVIVALGGWEPPEIVGLCEVENRQVLDDLVTGTPLAKYDYRILHQNSDDLRGIDVALLYRGDRVRLLQSRYYSLTRKGIITREILHAKVLVSEDTFHVFVNHWPSRSGGELETEKNRIEAARLLRSAVDSLFRVDSRSRIVIMGDFNDTPSDLSMSEVLQALTVFPPAVSPDSRLFNLSAGGDFRNRGTIKYGGQWSVFDQIIVSGAWFDKEGNLNAGVESFSILDKNFLLISDEDYGGLKPFRTYSGYSYQGGFSDHLPVYIDLY